MRLTGPWVAALIAAGYVVYAVNPRQAARYRERHGTSGAKSDAGDAHMLADMVRTDSYYCNGSCMIMGHDGLHGGGDC